MNYFLHHRFQSNNEVSLIRDCFKENKIKFREMDNLMIIDSQNVGFDKIAILLYEKLLLESLSKSDYLYLYTVQNEQNWFCIIIKKMGNAKMYNIVSRLKN